MELRVLWAAVKSAYLLCAVAAVSVLGALVGLFEAFGTEGLAFKLGTSASRALAVGEALEVLGLGLYWLVSLDPDDLSALDDDHAAPVTVWADSAVTSQPSSTSASRAIVNGYSAKDFGHCD